MDFPQCLNFFDIPDVVIQDHLFPLLHLHDLLRLRRVSKATKALAQEHLRLHYVNHPREIEIAENGDNNLSAFLAISIPASRIYINNNPGVNFYKQDQIPQFLELYASKITHLRVHHFSAFTDNAERSFFPALINLQHLELEEINATAWRCDFEFITMPDKSEIPRKPCPISKNFKNLKTLKFGHIEPFSKHDHGYWEDILLCCCEHLEYIGHPLYDHPLPKQHPFGIQTPPHLMQYTLGISNHKTFKIISRLIDWRVEKHPDKPNLKYFDFQNFKDTEEGGGSTMDFMMFLQDCNKRGLKLLNVDAELYQMLGPSEPESYFRAVEPLVSVKNLNRALFQRELPNLEKVVISATSQSTYYPFYLEHRIHKPEWPKLKILDLTVDSEELEELIGLDIGPQSVDELYQFLFTEVIRTALEEFALRFDEKASRELRLPCPRLWDLRTTCPNLKRLTFVNWVGTNKAMSMLWGGLELLEELVLEDCRDLGNVAFVGEKREEPTFLKLKSLKKLKMSGLDVMPKITDTVFNLVIRNMKLNKLFLSSRKPVTKITVTGIKSLLSGDFANSIEKFPFREWSLAGVSGDEFKKLEQQFRSYFMI